MANSPDNSVLSNAVVNLLCYCILWKVVYNVTRGYGPFLLSLLLSSTKAFVGINDSMYKILLEMCKHVRIILFGS